MEIPKIIKLNPENIKDEHICCAFADKKCSGGYENKKQWLYGQFNNGYTFKKFDIRGKVFIEYVPADKAWMPIVAPGYMLINCFWVSGQYKGQGYGQKLYEACLEDAHDMNGIVVLSSHKKMPFLSDKKFFTQRGFKVCDTAQPFYELLYLPLKEDAPVPQFPDFAKHGVCDQPEGITVYWSDACPFTEYYTAELAVVAREKGYAFRDIKIETRQQAQNHCVPFTIYNVFYNGKFLTQQILTEKSFGKMMEKF